MESAAFPLRDTTSFVFDSKILGPVMVDTEMLYRVVETDRNTLRWISTFAYYKRHECGDHDLRVIGCAGYSRARPA